MPERLEDKGGRSYPSKVLLFGEYSIIHNGMALAIPYPLFDGRLEFGRGKDEIESSQRELKCFARYLQQLQEAKELSIHFDLTSFFFDLEHGLYFSSSIPYGYGVGSSGAISAAVLGRYGIHWEKMADDLFGLRTLFARMESFFHGKSSGIDPLVSFLDKPLLIVSAADLKLVDLPHFGSREGEQERGAFFLLSTGRPHKTGPLVQLFLEKSSQEEFRRPFQEILIPTTHNCIENFLQGEWEILYRSFYTLSKFQHQHFAPMIPDDFQELWRKGIDQGDYLLKLCGAGGGGFLLGMTPNIEKTKKQLHHQQLRVLFEF